MSQNLFKGWDSTICPVQLISGLLRSDVCNFLYAIHRYIKFQSHISFVQYMLYNILRYVLPYDRA